MQRDTYRKFIQQVLGLFCLALCFFVVRVQAAETTETTTFSEITEFSNNETSQPNRDQFEEIIEEGGSVAPGAPGSFDETTIATVATTEQMTLGTEASSTEETVLSDESVVTEVAGSTISPSVNMTTGISTYLPQITEKSARLYNKQFILRYVQTQIKHFPMTNAWAYLIWTLPTFQTQLIEPVVVPMVWLAANILSQI